MLNPRANRTAVPRMVSAAAALAFLSISVPIAGFQAFAQTFSTLSGSVVDPQNRPVPGVTLTLSNVQNESKYEIHADGSGQFEFVGLPAADYVLEAALPGFETFRGSVAVAGSHVRQNITLQVGTVSEEIIVAGDSEEITVAGDADRSGGSAVAGQDQRRLQRILEACNASTDPSASLTGGNVRPPRKVKDVSPRYPDHLRYAGVGGVVKLDTRIGTDGSVRDVKVVDTGTQQELVAAAVDAVNQWQFEATLLNCVPVEVTMSVSIRFVAAPPPPPPSPAHQ